MFPVGAKLSLNKSVLNPLIETASAVPPKIA